MSFRIFINYRRNDTGQAAHALRRELIKVLPATEILIDVDLGIQPGAFFPIALRNTVTSSDLVVSLIGKHWFADHFAPSRVREKDYVFLEIEWALNAGIQIIPLLIDGAAMPESKLLPSGLQSFAEVQAAELSSKRFVDDVAKLIKSNPRLLNLSRLAAFNDARADRVREEDFSFVLRNGWSYAQLVERLIDLDFEITEDLGEDNEAPVYELAQAFANYPQTWRILVDDHADIVGYWRFVPLVEEKYRAARSGTLRDRELTIDTMSHFGVPDRYNIYIAFMGILPLYRTGHAERRLFFSLLSALDELAINGYYVESVCANGLTKTGQKLCRDLGMPVIRPHESRGLIFEDTMVNILQRRQRRSHLIAASYKGLIERYTAEFTHPCGV